MRTNPFSDAIRFLAQGEWTSYVFWLLTAGSLVIAVVNLLRNPSQRSALHLWNWLARLFIGAMWWEQSLWKIPPNYGGLRYWVEEMERWASTGLQRQFFFAPQVYVSEVLIAVTLILGIFSRFGAFLGTLMAINLWLGLYRSPSEWPWTYFFLIVIQIMFLVQRPGRSLGLDALLLQHYQQPNRGIWGRLVRLLS